MLIGTPKQATYAQSIIEGAVRWNWHKFNHLSLEDRGENLVALALIEAVVNGDIELAERICAEEYVLELDKSADNLDLLEHQHDGKTYPVPDWLFRDGLIVKKNSSEPRGYVSETPAHMRDAAVVAGAVIDRFKRHFYQAQQHGLVDRSASRPSRPSAQSSSNRKDRFLDGPPPGPPLSSYDSMADQFPETMDEDAQVFLDSGEQPTSEMDNRWEGLNDALLDEPMTLYREGDHPYHPSRNQGQGPG